MRQTRGEDICHEFDALSSNRGNPCYEPRAQSEDLLREYANFSQPVRHTKTNFARFERWKIKTFHRIDEQKSVAFASDQMPSAARRRRRFPLYHKNATRESVSTTSRVDIGHATSADNVTPADIRHTPRRPTMQRSSLGT